MRVALLLFAFTLSAHAQWDIQDTGAKSDFRGIASVGKGIAWASGTNGTVLRTEDGGYIWQPCAIPPGAEHLDFRGIQAFDEKTAIVMSSGKGDLSRIYKTKDGCSTWKLLFTNPDKEGFWDDLFYDSELKELWVLGDPVADRFRLFASDDLKTFDTPKSDEGPIAKSGQAAFAASNSLLIKYKASASIAFVSGGTESEFIWAVHGGGENFRHKTLPFPNAESSGAFSVASSSSSIVVVGGNYQTPNKSEATAAYTTDGGATWNASAVPPHGYRSAVAYDPDHKLWITVGPNGTDISTDDGKNWRELKPGPNDVPDADKNWNALSLPFVVGPKGRIGVLRPDALSAR